MPSAGTVASQSPSERVSLQGVPHECAVANEWTAMRVASHARIKLQADELQAAKTAECRVERRAKRQTASLEPSATSRRGHQVLSRALSHRVLSRASSH